MFITESFYKNLCTDILAKFPNYEALTISRKNPRPGEVLVCGLNEGFNYVEIDCLELDYNGNGSFEISFWLDNSETVLGDDIVVEDYEECKHYLHDCVKYCNVKVIIKENKISSYKMKTGYRRYNRISKKRLIEEFIKCVTLNVKMNNIINLIKFKRSFDKDYVYKI